MTDGERKLWWLLRRKPDSCFRRSNHQSFRSPSVICERKLWWLLRRKQLSGFRFRRQATIGPYIADFFSPQAKLIIEVDGVRHTDEERIYRDRDRMRWLETRGYRVPQGGR